jgi:outer membrane protein assembly factor BamB
MNKKFFPELLCCISAAFLVLGYFWSNPNLSLPLWNTFLFPASFFLEEVKLKPQEKKREVVHFRGDEKRTGFNRSESPKLSGENMVWEEGWNLGIHTASKASAVANEFGLYVGNDSGEFVRFDRKGSRVWTFRIPDSSEGIHGSAVLVGDSVCFGTYSGDLICLNQENGRLKWARNVGHAIGASPLVVGNVVYIAVELVRPRFDGYVVALSVIDGTLIWKTENFGEHPHSSPTLSSEGDVIGVGANNGKFYGIDPASGQILWERALGGPIKSTALAWKGNFYVSSWGKTFSALKSKDGQLLWQVSIPDFVQGSPTLLANKKSILLAVPGGLSVFDRESGRLLKNHDFPGSWGAMPSAIAFPNGIWASCGFNQICQLSPDGLQILRTFPVPGFLSGEPTLFGSSLILPTTGPLLQWKAKEEGTNQEL